MYNFLASATITSPDGAIHTWTANLWTDTLTAARYHAGRTLTAILDDNWQVDHYKVAPA